MLQTDFADVQRRVPYRRMIYTGAIDEYFGHRFGKLPYRSLRFEHVTLDKRQHQPVATVNYPQTQEYTRVTEYKHLTGQVHDKTSITYEYPSAEGDPYYPVPRPENQALYKAYERLALATPNVWFCGRLATYRYYNMDQVVGQALATFRRIEDTVKGKARRPTVPLTRLDEDREPRVPVAGRERFRSRASARGAGGAALPGRAAFSVWRAASRRFRRPR